MSDEQDGTRRQSAGAWLVLILLTVIYGLSFLDRSLLSLVIGLIKADFHMTDIQASFLFGLSFVLLYCLFSIPAGFLADCYNRSWLIAIALMLWSGMELLCGLAGSYAQLFIGRAGLGIGEAAISPAAYSIIRDRFPAHRRGLPYALFALGASIGTSLALVFSGSLLGVIGRGGLRDVAWLGSLHAWRIVLVVPALAGVPLALLMLLVRDVRPAPETGGDKAAARGFAEAKRHLVANRRLYWPLWLSFSFCAMPAFNNAWAPEAVLRFWHLPRPVVGHWLGLIQLACSVIGNLGGGLILNAIGRRGPATTMRVVTVAVSASVVLLALILGLKDLGLITPLWAMALIMTPICNPAVAAVQAVITPSHLMGKVIAIYYTVANLIAVGVGPTLVTLVARGLDGSRAMANALVITNIGCLLTAIAMMLISARALSQVGRRPVQNGGFPLMVRMTAGSRSSSRAR